MKAGEKLLYKDLFRGKEVEVEVIAILEVVDAKDNNYIGNVKALVQENFMSSSFLVDEEELFRRR